jgi:uncharacterized protein
VTGGPENRTEDRVARRVGARPPVAIDREIAFLGKPDSYPGRPRRVTAIETHFSWVFLTDLHAYKLKKPVRGEGFDFRTIAARRRNALAELRLNRRLAEDVYLSVVPLTLEDDGRLAISGSGRPIDWLVKMVRLDAGRMFDRRLACGDWHYGDIEALAQRLAGFFATARPARLSAPQLMARFRAEVRTALATVSATPDARLLTALKPIARNLECFMTRRVALFGRRIRERRMIDGHGDLRPEHIYLNGMPRIIDCLEFRPDLRQLDPINELAYLTLECCRLGGPGIGRALLRRYRERTGDMPPGELMHFYWALNAVVRARIALQHLAEPGARTRQELVSRAAEYLAAARKFRCYRL